MSRQSWTSFWLFLGVLISRLPFLFYGFGKEEDAWSNVLNAHIISTTGQYEVSRLPGHPLYELLLSYVYDYSTADWLFNGISALASALICVLQYRIARQLQLSNALLGSLITACIPVFFVASTYTIDYLPALACIMASFYALLRGQYLWAGILLGMATGIRISSIGMLLPFLYWQYSDSGDWKAMFRLCFLAVATAALCFSLPYLKYGWAFLDFHKPPFPGWASVLYKLSLGIWGLPLLGGLLFILLKRGKFMTSSLQKNWQLLIFGLLVLVLQLAVFLRLPFKAEFFIPALPFLLLLLANLLPKKSMQFLLGCALLSCLSFGFDYGQSSRGANASSTAIHFTAGGKDIFVDPIKGPLLLDVEKRQNKTALVEEVLEWYALQQMGSNWIISGWYWPELVWRLSADDEGLDAAAADFDYFSTEEELLEAQAQGKQLYYLPEIEEYNYQVYGHYLADSLAQPLMAYD